MKKWWSYIVGIILNLVIFGLVYAQEAVEEVAETAAGGASPWAHIGVALAIGIPALGTGWAQARIGSAGAGTLAERPEMAVWILILLAIPETVVILGFVIAFMLLGTI